MACSQAGTPSDSKIGFALDSLDDAGLIGPADGKRAVSYELCIPSDPAAIEEVRRIDPTARTSRSPGRLGCGSDQRLVVGHTHQEGYRRVLSELAALSYVERIEEAHFE